MNILSKIVAVFLLLVSISLGAERTWDGGYTASNNWLNATNWDGDTSISADDSLHFAGIVKLTNTNNFTAATQFSNITFDANAGGFTLAGNAIKLTGGITNNSAGSNQTVNLALAMQLPTLINAVSGNITLGGIISGSQPLIKIGGSNVTLSGVNTYTGGLVISNGFVSVNKDSCFGTNGTSLNPIIIDAMNSGCTGGLATTAAFTLNAYHQLNITNSGGIIYGNGQGFSGAYLIGNGALVLTGSAATVSILTLTSNNVPFCGTVSNNSGRILTGANNLIDPLGTNDITIAGGELYINNTGCVFSNIFRVAGNGSESRGTLRISQAFTFISNVVVQAAASIAADAAVNVDFNAQILGTNTLTLGGQTGSSTNAIYNLNVSNSINNLAIGSGILSFTNMYNLATNTTAVTINSGGTLRFATNNMIFNKTLGIANTASATERIDTGTNTVLIQGAINTGVATGFLRKYGTGTLIISNAANTVLSRLCIDQGTVMFTNGCKMTGATFQGIQIASGATTIVQVVGSPFIAVANIVNSGIYINGGSLVLNNPTNFVVGKLYVNGSLLPNGKYGAEGNPNADYAFRNKYITGIGTFSVVNSYNIPAMNRFFEPNFLDNQVDMLAK